MEPRSISRLTKSMLRSSRSSEALKLISLIRVAISDEVRGSSVRVACDDVGHVRALLRVVPRTPSVGPSAPYR